MTKTEIKVGMRCNNNCIFCLNDRRDIDRTTEQLMRMILEAKAGGITTIQFTGGEPTIRYDFLQLLAFTKSQGLNVEIQTNGRTCYYPEAAKAICSFGINHFLVSLHAHNEKLNLKLSSSPGAYEQTVQGIRNLMELKQFITINVVITSINAEYLEEIAKHHSRLGVSQVQFSWCRPQGKVKESYKLMPKYSEAIHALENALDYLTTTSVKASLIGVPRCVIKPEHRKLIADPYANNFVIRKGTKVSTTEMFMSEKKTFTAICNKCSEKNNCVGLFPEYLDHYSNDEIKPINNGK